MPGIFRLLLTLLTAAACGLLAHRLRAPAGLMVGAMLGAAALGLFGGEVGYMPGSLRPYLQALGGMAVGHKITRGDVRGMRALLWPSLAFMGMMVLMTVVIGLAMALTGRVSVATALFSSAPGGVAEMALVADEMGADTVSVALMQAFRLVTVLLVYPPFLKLLGRRAGRGENPGFTLVALPGGPKKLVSGTLLTLGTGALGAYLGVLSGFPAGAMLGAMFFSALANILTARCRFPKALNVASQIAVGALVGAQITGDTIAMLPGLLLPLAVLLPGMLLLSFLTGLLMRRLSGMDLVTSIMACTPGGINQMPVLAEDLGCDAPKIAILHTLRLVFVIAAMPSLIRLVASFFV